MVTQWTICNRKYRYRYAVNDQLYRISIWSFSERSVIQILDMKIVYRLIVVKKHAH